eukprot:2589640-Pyramimonas_sp.AAC.1
MVGAYWPRALNHNLGPPPIARFTAEVFGERPFLRRASGAGGEREDRSRAIRDEPTRRLRGRVD